MLIAVSFDVWNTLFDIRIVYEKLAKIIAESVNQNVLDIEKKIYDAYTRLRKIRLYRNDVNPRVFINLARSFLSRVLRIDYDNLVEAIDLVFSLITETSYSRAGNGILYSDVLPTLRSLKSIGIATGIIGNNVFWESVYTRRVIKALELNEYFNTQIYSDEIGVFKPDKRIFLEFCRRISVETSKTIHVGDSIAEDIGGALAVGMKAVHIDRSRKEKNMVIKELGLFVVNNLESVIEAIQVLE